MLNVCVNREPLGSIFKHWVRTAITGITVNSSYNRVSRPGVYKLKSMDSLVSIAWIQCFMKLGKTMFNSLIQDKLE